VDGRIEAGFRWRLRRLLAQVAPEGNANGVEKLMREAHERAEREGGPRARALALVCEGLERELLEAAPPWRRFTEADPPRFLCDPSLAGLARWLRAAGYEAALAPEVPGHRLPDEALRRGLVLVTTEAEALDRRIVADGSLAVVWVPSAFTMKEQLRMVARDLGLRLREPRCMACGGVQAPALKESVRARIPPRTARWKDEYFVCTGCDRLFWRGTHWERIARTLAEAVAS